MFLGYQVCLSRMLNAQANKSKRTLALPIAHNISHNVSRLPKPQLFQYHLASPTTFQVMEGPDNVYKSLEDYTSEERDNFVTAPDCRIRKPTPLYDWNDLD